MLIYIFFWFYCSWLNLYRFKGLYLSMQECDTRQIDKKHPIVYNRTMKIKRRGRVEKDSLVGAEYCIISD
ncbi:hypothetical protein HanPI659440_Chr12g0456141 [Helianthus annuus]|nr:hypothetical protein HanPI659440_Chr12g0456141 [Helianthus annuus]